ncbi:MAG: glycosyltransferase family 9 protein [Candidatus Rokubacteria bacterium]|nr:glycosyltransferase family 9 protein [Candidatus Rokubacteria bacterium]
MPALRALRAAAPGAPLALAAQPRIAALLAALGIVDTAHDFEALGLGRFFTEDGAPAPALLAGAARVVCWFGARDPAFVRRFVASIPDSTVAPPVGEGLVWRHLLASVVGDRRGGPSDASPGYCADEAGGRAPLAVPADARAAGEELLVRAGWDGAARVLLVHPGAGGIAKRWPTPGFVAALAPWRDRRDVFVVLHQGPADADAVAALRARMPRPLPVLVEPPLPALAGALARATAYLGNDSGISHLACAVGAPAIVLFREAGLRWRPWRDGVDILTVAMAAVEDADVAAVAAALAVKVRVQ